MSETEALRALMEADRWIDRVATQRTHLPETAELTGVDEELRRCAKDLAEAKASQVPVRTAYEAARLEAQRLSTRAQELDRTLSASTANARELAAVHTELEHVRQLLSSTEDRELELLIEVEPLDLAVSDVKGRAEPLLARRAELLHTVTQLQASLEEELASLQIARVERADALSEPLRATYDAIMKRVGTSGAAQVESGRCDGCRIALSPLDLDRFKAQPEGTFMVCPECGRLLVP